ncbi:sensor histidine kinase [Mycolicibacterium arenosum]|uniref:histidine kinase n=1 Tax=Mycolicibacterium arenosum TaxID=2952157 RepID=A0ABT1MCK7_9MYCO|nr:HAMP domain-containing sensor histidine kinase [Mycolicibacterium sp. CAU 1645]MCP9276903.1 HAMP domain-containing histidine kinase [Mycolicibacterium sp. CAU 1645]
MRGQLRRVAAPAQWTVRARATAAAVVVMALCLLVAGGALLFVMYSSLETSARATADSRMTGLIQELGSDTPAQLDASILATDSQVGIIQVVNQSGDIVARSAGSPDHLLSTAQLAPGARKFLGRMAVGDEEDFWVSAGGADTPDGPVTVLIGADREPVEKAVNTVAMLIAIGGPVVLALVGFGTHRLVGAALRPVERIRQRVAAMTGGNLGEGRVPVPPAQDEVARLAVTMNDMLDRLVASQNAQRRFVSDASHELRSPLASITAALDLAHQRPDLLDQSLIDDALFPEALRMQGLVEDLLLLARADESGGRHTRIDVDLDDIILREAERVRSLTHPTVEADVKAARVIGDPDGLSRMIRNLVDNAIRHAHSAIRLECGIAAGAAQIIVTDDGPGIPSDDRGRVFDRFVRLDQPRDRDSGGAGLGLAIVAQIVRDHGGRAGVDEAPGGGARFAIELPLAGDEPVADTANGLDAVAGGG